MPTLKLRSCLKCNGAVLECPDGELDSAFCINCGWRRPEASPADETLDESKNRVRLPVRGAHSRIGTGKPPLSGWARTKRRSSVAKQ